MPTIEFIGYPSNQRKKLIKQINPLMQTLDFAYTVVYLYSNTPTTIIALDGVPRPLLRIYTRYEDRANKLLELLKHIADIEVVFLANFQIKCSPLSE